MPIHSTKSKFDLVFDFPVLMKLEHLLCSRSWRGVFSNRLFEAVSYDVRYLASIFDGSTSANGDTEKVVRSRAAAVPCPPLGGQNELKHDEVQARSGQGKDRNSQRVVRATVCGQSVAAYEKATAGPG